MTLNLLFDHFDRLITCPGDLPRLNQAILQLAVQGKLVPQDPADEPASELLKRIRAEKDHLLLTGQLRRDEPLPPIADDEIPYELPLGWTWVRLEEISTIRGGKRVPAGYQLLETPTNHIYIRVSDMKNGTIVDTDLRYISEDIFEEIKNYIIESSDLYITIAGTIGAVGDIPEKFHCMNLTENAARITPYLVNKAFLKLALNSRFVQGQFLQKTNQMAQPKLALIRIRSTIFPLPPLAEQKRIVARVESLLAQSQALAAELAAAETEGARLSRASLHHLLAAPHQTSEVLETSEVSAVSAWRFVATHFDAVTPGPESVDELKQAILQLAVQGKLVPQDSADEPASELLKRIEVEKKPLVQETRNKETPPFEIPNSWEWVTVGQIGEVIGGLTKNSNRNAFPLKMPYLRVANVYANELRLDDIQEIGIQTNEIERVSLSKGDLLVVEGNGSIEQIGRVAIWDGSIDPCLHQNHIIKVRFKLPEIGEYILYWFLSAAGRKEITRLASTTTGLHTLSLSKVSVLPIPLPPLAEQKRIVAKVESLLRQGDELKAALVAGEAARVRVLESVLHGLVNGTQI